MWASFPAQQSCLVQRKMRTRGQSIKLLDFREELLLKIIACLTTTEGRGLLLCCRRLSDLARPNVLQKRQKEVRIFIVFFGALDLRQFRALLQFGPSTRPLAGCGAGGYRFFGQNPLRVAPGGWRVPEDVHGAQWRSLCCR